MVVAQVGTIFNSQENRRRVDYITDTHRHEFVFEGVIQLKRLALGIIKVIWGDTN